MFGTTIGGSNQMVFGTFSLNNQIKSTALIWAFCVLVVKSGVVQQKKGKSINVAEVCNASPRKGRNFLKRRILADERTRFCKLFIAQQYFRGAGLLHRLLMLEKSWIYSPDSMWSLRSAVLAVHFQISWRRLFISSGFWFEAFGNVAI